MGEVIGIMYLIRRFKYSPSFQLETFYVRLENVDNIIGNFFNKTKLFKFCIIKIIL